MTTTVNRLKADSGDSYLVILDLEKHPWPKTSRLLNIKVSSNVERESNQKKIMKQAQINNRRSKWLLEISLEKFSRLQQNQTVGKRKEDFENYPMTHLYSWDLKY